MVRPRYHVGMIKRFHTEVWAFDAEWVPDPVSGRMSYALDSALPDEDVISEMWRRGGATAEEPRPYLKTILCRVVSLAAVKRRAHADGRVELELRSIPAVAEPGMAEHDLLDRFLSSLGRRRPQLVGFNSTAADLPILMQRAMAHALHQPAFCERPDKPWLGPDYFAKYSDWHIDLRDVLCGFGRASMTLHELATVCGIPGKLDTAGSDVVELWRQGDVRRIVQYNECDALTTYLVWVRLAHLCGHFSAEQFGEEERRVEQLLQGRVLEGSNGHLARYLDVWRSLREARAGVAATPRLA